ncbi:MAG: hypothetical protein IPL52_04335 [Flavobacteriales bacterium]|nr:hypothetical protein [Flavobacteriales bacterium]
MMPRNFRNSAVALLQSGLIAVASFIGTAPRAMAQAVRACVCSDLGAEVVQEPDTVFHIVPRFDAALCGKIDRSVTPFVYGEFTIRSCGTFTLRPLRTQSALHDCHITVSGGMLVVDELRSLPTGPDMHLATRPCWRTYYVLRVHEDTAQYAINAMKDLIADLPKPTPDQVARIQARWDALPPSIYWMDRELLGQVFLCALHDAEWFRRFSEVRETYRFGGAVAVDYDELLAILHAKRAGHAE